MSDFIENTNWTYVFAGLFMLLIFSIVIYIILILYTTIKKRRALLEVKLPEIDKRGIVEETEPQFDKERAISVELISAEEDESIKGENREYDENFFKALSLETGIKISEDDFVKLDLPEVGELNFEEIKRKKQEEIEKAKEEREQANIEHLRELAKADEEIEMIVPEEDVSGDKTEDESKEESSLDDLGKKNEDELKEEDSLDDSPDKSKEISEDKKQQNK